MNKDSIKEKKEIYNITGLALIALAQLFLT